MAVRDTWSANSFMNAAVSPTNKTVFAETAEEVVAKALDAAQVERSKPGNLLVDSDISPTWAINKI